MGKVLIFVQSVDMCYKVKMFLEQFSIKAAVLNAELPQNSRLHILDQFNRGVCDIVVATDSAMEALEDDEDEDEEGADGDEKPLVEHSFSDEEDISGDEKEEEDEDEDEDEEEEEALEGE